jgi:dienelactone hydrolase
MHSSQNKKLSKNRPKTRNNNCTLLVCSDIFGINPALEAFFRDWQGELLLLSPYAKQQHFSDDQQAYQYFLQHGGFDSYRQKLKQTLVQLTAQQRRVIAVGFSAGAAALWCELGTEPGIEQRRAPPTSALSAEQSAVIQQAFCFYGGQIRHFADLTPSCLTTLIWAQETHFDVKALAGALAEKTNVRSYISHYQHGFINPKSAGYHKQGAAYYQRVLLTELRNSKAD